VLATVLALWYVVSLIGSGFDEGFDIPDAETAAVVVVFSYCALSTVVAWLSDRVGGAMLVVAGLALAVLVPATAGRNRAIATVIVAGPFVVAGGALLWSVALRDRLHNERESGR
jgi:hypothetical protein